MAEPRVTVIIPTYNWSTVLPFSIASVLEQTFSDFELLVIGDGCTDDSEAVVASIADPRVRWINIARSGHQSGPNNEGLRQARGSLIAYLGHDDLWLRHHLALHVAAFERGADFTCSLAAAVGPEGRFVDVTPPDLERGWWTIPTVFAHRRSLSEKIGGWRDYRKLRVAPEQDFVGLVLASGACAEIVPRLTAIKIPAGLRRDVYRTRPSHEQAQWLGRIRSEPDLEASLLAQVIIHPVRELEGTPQRMWRLLRQPSQWFAFFKRSGGNRIRARQRFKGVDDAGRSTEGRTAGHEGVAEDRAGD